MPYAFTEYGVAMLSSVLSSKRAIQVNIQIMLVFSKIREMLLDTLSMKLDIEEIKKRLDNQDKNLELVFTYLDERIRPSKYTYEVLSGLYERSRFWGRRSESLLAG